MKEIIKKIVFVLIITLLIIGVVVIAKVGKFEKLEGYKYSLALDYIEIRDDEWDIEDSEDNSNTVPNNSTVNNSTEGNATSSNATSSNATSSNATSCNATSTNATSSNSNNGTTITETIKVTNTPTEEIEPEPETPEIKPNPNTQNKQDNENEEDNEINLEYNNSEITKDILNKIANSTKLENITINMDKNTNISKDIFEAIEGKNVKLIINSKENQIIFRGNSITNPKKINAEITYNLISEDLLLREIVAEGIVVNFADNGELPGTATVRIKVTDEISEALSFNKMPIYYYNEKTKELTKLKSNAKYNKEGYIEFSIKHNSKYLIVNDVIEEKEYTVTTTQANNTVVDNEVSFLESHRMYILIIGISVLTIIIVATILIVDKKTKGKANRNY